jgi:hypothetical protein
MLSSVARISSLTVALAAVAFALPAGAEDNPGKTGLFNTRYCEILAGVREGMKARITVYNTIGFNDCPAAQWDRITAKAAASALGVEKANLNGPRYWLMDGIKGKGISATGKTIDVDGIRMGERATLEISLAQALAGNKPYIPNVIDRETIFSFKAGKPVFELTDPKGQIYIMQSYSRIVNRSQTLNDLETLGSKLKLPKGWRFSTRLLTGDYDLTATGKAYVVQDEFLNTYQRRTN